MSVQGAFARHARSFVGATLARVPAADARDAYVASLFVFDEHDDPTRPSAAVGYNTEAAVAAATVRGIDPAEARWNYEHWLQNDLGTLAGELSDPTGARLRAQWLAHLMSRDGVTPVEEHHQDILEAFMALLAGVLSALHGEGAIAAAFGRPVPVLVHGLVYDVATLRHNRRANPGGLAEPFADWLNNTVREE